MISLTQIMVLALVQGLTEFLPVSSSAHLILGGKIFGWPDQGLVFDVAVHLGTLLAVLVYFRKDLWSMVVPWLPTGPGKSQGTAASRQLGLTLVVASIPAIVAGGLLHNLVETVLRDIRVIAVSTLVFGLLLWWADARFQQSKSMQSMNMQTGFIIGLAQVLALVPGTSRSGITITMGRMLGFDADSSARFSFLLSIPIIAAAGGYGILRMLLDDAAIDWQQFALAVGLAAIAGWICIAAFLALLKRVSLMPFVLYRLALGVVLVWLGFFQVH